MNIVLIPFIFASFIFSQNIDSLYLDGNNKYNNKEYYSAINSYERILEEDYQHQDLYLNLGNAYFRNGSIGNAIWAYEKGKILSPRDKDLNYNLLLLNKKTRDEISKPEQLLIFRLYKSYIEKFNIVEMLGFIGILLFFLGILNIVKNNNNLFLKIYKNLIIAIVFILLLIIGSSIDKLFKITLNNDAIVVLKEIDVRSSPLKISNNILFKVHEGARVIVGQESNDWYQIELYDGKKGWALKNSLRLL